MNDLKDFECSVCKEIYQEPMRLECSHIFCKECLSRSVANCPECRHPIQHSAMQRAIDVKKRMESRDTECEKCQRKMKICELRAHENLAHNDLGQNSPRVVGTRPKTGSQQRLGAIRNPDNGLVRPTSLFDRVQRYDAAQNTLDPRFITRATDAINLGDTRGNVDAYRRRRRAELLHTLPSDSANNPTELFRTPARQQGSNSRTSTATGRNWDTFTCAYCSQSNLDRETLLEHCNSLHQHAPDHQLVCPICPAYPSYGDANLKSGNLLNHLNRRHQYDVDRYADLNRTDEEATAYAIINSLHNIPD